MDLDIVTCIWMMVVLKFMHNLSKPPKYVFKVPVDDALAVIVILLTSYFGWHLGYDAGIHDAQTNLRPLISTNECSGNVSHLDRRGHATSLLGR
jgi:hypothetical protein